MNVLNRLKFLFIIVIPVVIIDQISKAIIADTLYLYQSIKVIPGILNIVYVRNKGAAFGILSETNTFLGIPILAVAAFIAVGVIFYLYMKEDVPSVGLPLIMGGTLGNLIDRVRMGEVVDFIDIYLKFYHWPAFNVADMAITSGALLLLVTLIFPSPPPQKVQ